MEGIDLLAQRRGVEVADLTRKAMEGGLPLEEVYEARLQRIQPTAEDLEWLAAEYRRHQVPGARASVETLAHAGVPSFVLSGGLRPAVVPFAESLGIPERRVLAVPFQSMKAEDLQRSLDHPLARDGGKWQLIQELCTEHGWQAEKLLLIGDGHSDLEAAAQIGMFIAFAGVAKRPKVVQASPVVIRARDLSPVPAFALPQSLWPQWQEQNPSLYRRGRAALEDPDRVYLAAPWTPPPSR